MLTTKQNMTTQQHQDEEKKNVQVSNRVCQRLDHRGVDREDLGTYGIGMLIGGGTSVYFLSTIAPHVMNFAAPGVGYVIFAIGGLFLADAVSDQACVHGGRTAVMVKRTNCWF